MPVNKDSENKLMRRVAGYHDIRWDGMTDVVTRARIANCGNPASVLDIGCNRGLVGFELVNNGATKLHGVDIDEECIDHCRKKYIDFRLLESRFEVVDLTKGPQAFSAAFGPQKYDIVFMLATYHKLNRRMPEAKLSELMRFFGSITQTYFAWRATSDKYDENEQEMRNLDRDLGLKRVHTSYISKQLGVCAVWERQ